jgi:hypothetical protein
MGFDPNTRCRDGGQNSRHISVASPPEKPLENAEERSLRVEEGQFVDEDCMNVGRLELVCAASAVARSSTPAPDSPQATNVAMLAHAKAGTASHRGERTT